jgi:hypothetical protein
MQKQICDDYGTLLRLLLIWKCEHSRRSLHFAITPVKLAAILLLIFAWVGKQNLDMTWIIVDILYETLASDND